MTGPCSLSRNLGVFETHSKIMTFIGLLCERDINQDQHDLLTKFAFIDPGFNDCRILVRYSLRVYETCESIKHTLRVANIVKKKRNKIIKSIKLKIFLPEICDFKFS